MQLWSSAENRSDQEVQLELVDLKLLVAGHCKAPGVSPFVVGLVTFVAVVPFAFAVFASAAVAEVFLALVPMLDEFRLTTGASVVVGLRSLVTTEEEYAEVMCVALVP